MNIATKTRKTAIATVAAFATIAAMTTVQPTEAQANGKAAAAFIGGAIVGGILGAHSQRHVTPVYTAPVYTSCHWRWETRYNTYGQPYNVKVKYCG